MIHSTCVECGAEVKAKSEEELREKQKDHARSAHVVFKDRCHSGSHLVECEDCRSMFDENNAESRMTIHGGIQYRCPVCGHHNDS